MEPNDPLTTHARASQEIAVVTSPGLLRQTCDDARSRGLTVGFVPTMGALHEGHLGLVRLAKTRATFVVASIFVNPTQFGPNEDFARYPRDLDGDRAKLASAGADCIFAPDATAMYPAGEQTRVRVGAITEPLCGAFRPGHFEGVATVVSKLFALVGPSVAVFGKKDYQQLAVLRRMTIDLFFPVEIVGAPIVREADGVAMSSRNAYLSPAERERARALSRGLAEAWQAHRQGARRAGALRSIVQKQVATASERIDYVSIADPDTLEPLAENAEVGPRALLAIAAYVGATRLLDNVVLGEDPSPLTM